MISQIIKQESFETRNVPLNLVYMGTESGNSILTELPGHFNVYKQNSLDDLRKYLSDQTRAGLPDIILLEVDASGDCFLFIEEIKNNPLLQNLIIILIANKKDKAWKLRALQLKVHDYYNNPFPIEHLVERISFLAKFKTLNFPKTV